MSKWIGYAVSVNCGETLGCYQGTILEADGSTITLTKAFRNGFPYPKSQVTLKATDIKELRIIERRASPPAHAHAHSTVPVTKSKKCPRSTVCENLQSNPSSSSAGNQQQAPSGGANNSNSKAAAAAAGGARGPASAPARSKPIDIQASRNKNTPHTGAGSYPHPGSTPKGRGAGAGGAPGAGQGAGAGGHEKQRRRNEACFGDAADPALDHDFDFEGNLALFDKRALWEQMNNSHKPDLVRQTGDSMKYRHDENVLGGGCGGGGGGGGARREHAGTQLPAELALAAHYVTDEGVRVPGASRRLRAALWAALRRHALDAGARLLLARAAADLALRLLGGGRRLDPANKHQTPSVVVLCGAHGAGAAGAEAARLLLSHGVRVSVLVAGEPAAGGAPGGQCELSLGALALAGVQAARALRDLPHPDLVLLALHDVERDEPHDQYTEALLWTSLARAVVVVMEPPDAGAGGAGAGGAGGAGAGGAGGAWAPVSARACVSALLPGAPPPELGQLWLANVAPPARLLRSFGVHYRPPFGAAAVIALHPTDL